MNCLLTKLNDAVSDTSIYGINEMRFDVVKLSEWQSASFYLQIETVSDVVLSIIGDGYFTDASGQQNLGTRYPKKTYTSAGRNIYVSNSNCQISISDKTAVKLLKFNPSKQTDYNVGLSLDLSQLNYMINLEELSLSGNFAKPLYGNIEDTNEVLKLQKFPVGQLSFNNNIKGDISKFGCANVTNIDITNTSVTGDISAISKFKNVKEFVASSTKIYGKISSIKDLSTLERLSLYNTSVELDDLALVPENCSRISCSGWANWSNRTGYILSILGRPQLSDQLDKMLINQAELTLNPKDTDKTIDVDGLQTNLSDSAISTLKSKGLTIKVNGVEK